MVAVGALVGWALGALTPMLSRVDIVFGAALLGCAVVASGTTEWRAQKRLRELLRTSR